MSQRVVRYEGEGRSRRPVYADEGPSSAAAHDPIAMHANGGLPHLGAPSGGAGPVERRLITEAERDIRAEGRPGATAVQRAWNEGLRTPISAAVIQEDPVSESRADYSDPIPGPVDALSDLAEAVVVAIEARDAKGIAEAAWQIAQRGLAAAWRALPPLDLLDDTPRPDKVEPAPVATVRPSAEGGRATADQLQASRRNGQANMQAQRRAVELTTAAAVKVAATKGNGGRTAGQTRTPEQRETMRVAQLASIARRKAAKAS